MSWIIVLTFLVGMLAGGILLGALLVFLHGFSAREEAAAELDPPHYGP